MADVTTDQLGREIAAALEGNMTYVMANDGTGSVRDVIEIDGRDPSNLRILLNTGERFVLRIVREG